MPVAEIPQPKVEFRRFVLWTAAAFTLLAALPFLISLMLAPPGSAPIGAPYNTDDHMVYAAWMRQAADFHIFFDNRFTTDAQPGLTVHVYFLILGWLAKLVGITWAMVLGRLIGTFAFVVLLGRFIELFDLKLFAAKLSLGLACVGGGIGFAMWRSFGVAYDGPMAGLTLGGLPIDAWQPEAFVFPSMLTNGLFMVSLCLIVYTLTCVVRARESWKPVVGGAVAFGVLMNIHSYDVLLVAFILIGLLVMSLARKAVSTVWVLRVVVIGIGAVPAALWFVYVLRNDPVFQARAATETFSPNFRQVLAGIVPALALAFAGLDRKVLQDRRRIAGFALLILGLAVGFACADPHTDRYWLGVPAFSVAAVWSLVVLFLIAGDRVESNLLWAWAVVSLVAPYVPGLFQRKLLMAIEVPWALLAAQGAWQLMERGERAKRNLAGAMLIVVFAASSLRWLSRELMLIRMNVSNTTVHPVYLDADEQKIVRLLDASPGRKVVLAMPGVPSRTDDPDVFATPYIPDLNPILSGLTGSYTYAGHWSETPSYNAKRREVVAGLFLQGTSTPESQQALIQKSGATHIVAPEREAFPQAELADLSALGEVVYRGTRFSLIKVR